MKKNQLRFLKPGIVVRGTDVEVSKGMIDLIVFIQGFKWSGELM